MLNFCSAWNIWLLALIYLPFMYIYHWNNRRSENGKIWLSLENNFTESLKVNKPTFVFLHSQKWCCVLTTFMSSGTKSKSFEFGKKSKHYINWKQYDKHHRSRWSEPSTYVVYRWVHSCQLTALVNSLAPLYRMVHYKMVSDTRI